MPTQVSCVQLQGSLFDAPCHISSCLLSTMKIGAVASGVPRIEQIVWIWSMKSLPLNLNMFGVGRETDRATLFGAKPLLLKHLEALFSWNDRSLQWFKD